MENPKIHVLILGASGRLGYLVTKHCLQRPDNFIVSALVRDDTKIKDLTESIEKSGGRVIIGDLSNPDTALDLTKDIHTIISCIGTFGEQEVTSQTNVLNDAAKNGAKRFFASHFGINYQYAPKDNDLINGKLNFNKRLYEQKEVLPVVITCGVFYEFFIGMHAKGLEYWGDVDQKIDMIAYDDIARYTVEVASQPELSGNFAFVGAQVSVREVADTYNKVHGAHVEPKKLGTIEDLKNLAEEKKKEGGLEGTFLQLFSHIYGGKGLSPSTNNAEFPQVKVKNLEDVLKENQDLEIPE